MREGKWCREAASAGGGWQEAREARMAARIARQRQREREGEREEGGRERRGGRSDRGKRNQEEKVSADLLHRRTGQANEFKRSFNMQIT